MRTCVNHDRRSRLPSCLKTAMRRWRWWGSKPSWPSNARRRDVGQLTPPRSRRGASYLVSSPKLSGNQSANEDIQKVLCLKLGYLAGAALDKRVDDPLEKAMRNHEELRQVEKDHGRWWMSSSRWAKKRETVWIWLFPCYHQPGQGENKTFQQYRLLPRTPLCPQSYQ